MPEGIEVTKGDRTLAGPGRPYGGQAIFEAPDAHVGLSRLGVGAVTPWHHHGSRSFYGYIIQGTLVLEFGPSGGRRAPFVPSDFFLIHPGVVHRDVNESEAEALVATMSVGVGPLSVQADGPHG